MRRRRHRQMVQQLAGELPRYDHELLARLPIDHAHVDARRADALAQLGGEIPLDLLPGKLPDARQQRPDLEPRPGVLQQRVPDRDAVARVAFPHLHLVGAAVGARRSHRELLADRPERKQADSELALDALRPVELQPPLDRVADVGRDVAEVRRAFGVLRDAGAVVGDRQVMLASLPAAGDGDVARACVDRVLDELGDRLQRVLLRQGDDGDRIPVVADAELSGRADLRARSLAVGVAGLFHRPILADGRRSRRGCGPEDPRWPRPRAPIIDDGSVANAAGECKPRD